MSSLVDKPKKIMCADIVDAYGSVLERVPYGVGMTLPSGELPYEANIIKEALAACATQTIEQQRRDTLKAGFLELSAFVAEGYKPDPMLQPGFIPPESREELAAFAATRADQVPDSGKLAQRIADKRALLEEEWRLRINLQAVSAAGRISE